MAAPGAQIGQLPQEVMLLSDTQYACVGYSLSFIMDLFYFSATYPSPSVF